MKFTIEKKYFLKPIQKLNNILLINRENPIINNILFYIHKKNAYLISTTLELELISKINCSKVFYSGEVLVSGKKILNIVRSFPNESEILVNVQNNIMELRYQNICFTLNTLNSKNFPKFKIENITQSIIINQNDLKNIIYNTHYAMAKQDMRHYLNGMNIEASNGKIFTIATDGYRMAISYIQHNNTKKHISIIIPRKTILELIKILEYTDYQVKIHIGNKIIQFYLAQYILSSKLIDSQFPKYKSLLKHKLDKSIIINREHLKQALIRASILSHQKLQGVRIIIQKGLCIVRSNNEYDETTQEKFQINCSELNIELTMNINYILDVINITNTNEINIFLNNISSAIYIKNLTPCKSLHIIMPLIL